MKNYIGNASYLHEKIVDKYNAAGFAKWQFMAFIKSILLDVVSADELYKLIFESESDNRAKQKMKRKMKTLLDGYTGKELYVEALEPYLENPYADLPPIEELRLLSKVCSVIPDAWRYHDGYIDVIEVVDQCGLTFDKLTKLSIIEDAIFYRGNIRLRVFEHPISGNIFWHDTGTIYDMNECTVIYDMNKKNNSEKLRMYYDIVGPEKIPSDILGIAA